MIEGHQLVKHYGPHRVLDGASLTVRGGECLVLSGENGSGKTTLLHILVGLRRPDTGRVAWAGRDLTGGGRRSWQRARRAWGFLPQDAALPVRATVNRLVRFHLRLRGAEETQAHDWLERVGLADRGKQRVAALSGGMRQRLAIALSLFHEPELIVMDEPGAGLDPAWRRALAAWLEEASRRGAAVLATSQLREPWGAVRRAHCAAGRIVDDPPQEAAAA